MFSVKPERILTRVYPDQALLDSLTNVAFEQAKIPEHEFIQFRRLQSLIYQIRVAGYDIEAMQTEAFLGAIQHAYVNCKVAVTSCEYDWEINDGCGQRDLSEVTNGLVWLTTNAANLDHPKIRALPIGLTDYCDYSPYHWIIGDSEKFKSYIDAQPRTEKNLVLMNFNESTKSFLSIAC